MSNQTDSSGLSQTQDAVNFINEAVLTPKVKPIKGTATPMVEQAVGMMVQDLQSFLKGFEQISLVALAKLANNYLTYGNYYNPSKGLENVTPEDNKTATTKTAQSEADSQSTPIEAGQNIMKELFSIVGEYGKQKAQVNAILSAMYSSDANMTMDIGAFNNNADNNQQSESSSTVEGQNTANPEGTKERGSWFSRKK